MKGFSYTVTATGWIGMADGRWLSPQWMRHVVDGKVGADFFNSATGMVLRADSGWIGRVENWAGLSSALDESLETPSGEILQGVAGLPRYTVYADDTGLYLIPDEPVDASAAEPRPAVRLPLDEGARTVHPENSERPTTTVETVPARGGDDESATHLATAWFDEPRDADAPGTPVPGNRHVLPGGPDETRATAEADPDRSAAGRPRRPDTVIAPDGITWLVSSKSVSEFCVNVTVVWVK